MAELLKEYDTSLDSKNRFTVRSVKKAYKNYHVCVFDDGKILMEPRLLVDPKYVSKRTLSMMDKAMENYAKGKVGKVIDLRKMKELSDALPD